MKILVTCMCGRWHTPWCTVSIHSLCASAEISLGTQWSCKDCAKIETQPFMMSWLLPSMAPLVPSSAKRKASKCWNLKCCSSKCLADNHWCPNVDNFWFTDANLGLPVEHLSNFGEVGKCSFLASNSHHLRKLRLDPGLKCFSFSHCDYYPVQVPRFFLTCGGLITNFFFSPATMSGFLSLIIPNTLWKQVI